MWKSAAETGQALGICINLGLLLRSLRACSLEVVLVKVARCLYIYPGPVPFPPPISFTY